MTIRAVLLTLLSFYAALAMPAHTKANETLASKSLISINDATLVYSKALKTAVCMADIADAKSKSNKETLFIGLEYLFAYQRNPIFVLEHYANPELYSTIQNLKLQVMNLRPNIQRIESLSELFRKQFIERSQEEDAYRNSVFSGSYMGDPNYWLSHLIAQNMSLETYTALMRANLKSTRRYSEYLSTVSGQNIWDKNFINENKTGDPFGTFFNNSIAVLLIKLNHASTHEQIIDYSKTPTSPDLVHSILGEIFHVISYGEIAIRLRELSLNSSPMSDETLRAMSILSQLEELYLNPQKVLCGNTSTSSDTRHIDWCLENDDEFLLKLEILAEQANSTARTMRNENITAVQGVVGINGQHCSIRGAYHLIKTGAQEVSLYTTGELLIAKNNQSQRSLFREDDLIIALKTNAQFKKMSLSGKRP